MKKISVAIALSSSLQIGCFAPSECEDSPYCIGGNAGDIAGVTQTAAYYPLVDDAYTALQQVWQPNAPDATTLAAIIDGSMSIYQHDQFAPAGLGVTSQAGIPWVEHQELAPGFSQGAVGERMSLAYLWVVADPQIIDEESPIRMEGYAELYRPHGALTPHTFEAHVRSAQRLSDLSGRPFDFALLPGDLTDTTQENELEWMLTILNGGVVDPDSGVDNDPVIGAGNDYNDPFISDGIDVPWYAAIGNHDVVWVGGLGVISPKVRLGAEQDHLFTDTNYNLFRWPGYVDGNSATGAVVLSPFVTTPADVARVPLTKNEFLQTLLDADGLPAGHGLTQADVNNERGYYSSYPVSGKPIKLIVLDTTDKDQNSPLRASKGAMKSAQFNWLQSELNAAQSANELVIIMSHHRLQDFTNNSEASAASIRSLLASFPNVALHITGHGHMNTKQLQEVNGVGSYWELMTAAPIDFPMQSRIVELVDEGNGFLSIYVTNFDHNSPEDSLAHYARELAAAKLAFGTPDGRVDVAEYWAAEMQTQNLLLRLPLPGAVASELAGYSWSQFVESEDTLNQL